MIALDAFLITVWFFLWMLWFVLLYRIVVDIFRSKALGGWGKTCWLVLVITLPFLGVFVYLATRGHKMPGRGVARAQTQDQAFRAHMREAAHGTSTAGELARLGDLRDHGVTTEADFQQGKDKIPREAA